MHEGVVHVEMEMAIGGSSFIRGNVRKDPSIESREGIIKVKHYLALRKITSKHIGSG